MMPVITNDEGKIIVFVKKNHSGDYQLYPRPPESTAAEFFEFEIDHLQELDYKIFIFNQNNELFFIDKSPEPADCYQYNFDEKKWALLQDKKLKLDVASAEHKKASLLNALSRKIDIINDAAELGIATDDDKLSLTELKRKRVSVSRIDTNQPDNIDWKLYDESI